MVTQPYIRTKDRDIFADISQQPSLSFKTQLDFTSCHDVTCVAGVERGRGVGRKGKRVGDWS